VPLARGSGAGGAGGGREGEPLNNEYGRLTTESTQQTTESDCIRPDSISLFLSGFPFS